MLRNFHYRGVLGPGVLATGTGWKRCQFMFSVWSRFFNKLRGHRPICDFTFCGVTFCGVMYCGVLFDTLPLAAIGGLISLVVTLPRDLFVAFICVTTTCAENVCHISTNQHARHF